MSKVGNAIKTGLFVITLATSQINTADAHTSSGMDLFIPTTEETTGAVAKILQQNPEGGKGIDQNPERDGLGKFDFVKEYKDEQNKNWKLYKCSLNCPCTCEQLEKIYNNQFGVYERILLGRNFCDKDGNIIMHGYDGWWVFDKGEMVYLRIPNRDIVTDAPEMTMNDVENLSDSEIREIFKSFGKRTLDSSLGHADKNGDYVIINGKKLYIERDWYEEYVNIYPEQPFEIQDSKYPFLMLLLRSDYHHKRDSIDKMAIGEYRGNKFHGIIYNKGNITRGSFDADYYNWD